LKKMADFRTAENFTLSGIGMPDNPYQGKGSVKEQDVYMGSLRLPEGLFSVTNLHQTDVIRWLIGGKPDSDKHCSGGSCLITPPYYISPCFGSQ